jgi:hypothetical protein
MKRFLRLFDRTSRLATRSVRTAPRGRLRLDVEALEGRLLLHGGCDLLPMGAGDPDHGHEATLHGSPAIEPDGGSPFISSVFNNQINLGIFQLSYIPSLSSKPGAEATVYLDFDGHYQGTWGSYSNISTPAFSADGDATTFYSADRAAITEIWKRVAEDFAPFDVNVTTVNPGSFGNGQALRVAIGGSSSWYGSSVGGLGYVNSFTNSIANVVYVFPQNLSNSAKYIADASSHEAGHGFGLEHQSAYNASGQKTAEYNPGTSAKAPIMGNSYYSTRSLWWYGTTESASTYQDDMAVIARAANGFGYRADDHSDSIGSSATPLTRSGSSVSGSGIIARTSDEDVFSFYTTGGQVTLTVDVAAVGANLDAKLELYRLQTINLPFGGSLSLPVLIASADPSNSLGATISTNLGSGTYYLMVRSHGSYGDVGQYTISGTAPRFFLVTDFRVPFGGLSAASGSPVGADEAAGPLASSRSELAAAPGDMPASPRLDPEAVATVLAGKKAMSKMSEAALDLALMSMPGFDL